MIIHIDGAVRLLCEQCHTRSDAGVEEALGRGWTAIEGLPEAAFTAKDNTQSSAREGVQPAQPGHLCGTCSSTVVAEVPDSGLEMGG